MDLSAKNICVNCMRKIETEGKCPHCGYGGHPYKSSPHHLPVGTILMDRYWVGRVLGEGVFGITYAGKDIKRQTAVAIKEYYPDGIVTRDQGGSTKVQSLSDTALKCFARGRSLFLSQGESLTHFVGLPGLINVRSLFEENNTAYLVMDRIDGMNILAYAERLGGKIRPAQLFSMMRPVIETLEKIHEARIFHQDICPENLMVDDRGAVCLVDFGAARVCLTPSDEKALSATLRSGYSAQELYSPNPEPNAKGDLYALCATMYRLLSGIKPPDAPERGEHDSLAMPSNLGIRMDPRMEEALMAGLAILPEARPDSMAALKAALYGSAPQPEKPERPKATEPAPPAKTIPAKKKRKHRWVWALVIIALIAGAATGGYYYLKGQGLSFADPAFEKLLRIALNKPSGVLTASSVANVTGMTIEKDAITLEYQTPKTPDSGATFGEITSLEDLKLFPALTKLSIRNQQLNDLSPLSTLHNLTDLGLNHCDLQDISPLSSLAKITSLYLYNNEIENISALSSMKKLTQLSMDGNNIADLSPMAEMNTLISFSAEDNQIEDISALAGLDSLSQVSLTGNPIQDWAPVARIAEVFGRPESDAPVSFVDKAFEGMIRKALGKPDDLLRAADLATIDRIAIQGSTLLFELRFADSYMPVDQGDIHSLEDFAYFTGLKALYIADNPIEDLSPLTGLSELTSLTIAGCNLRDISPVGDILSLHTLAFPANRVQDISALSSLSLVQLNAKQNAIQDISPLSQMSTLIELSIDQNNIQSLDPLKGLPNLAKVSAGGNPVADWTPVESVAEITGNEPTPLPFIPITFTDKTFEKLLCEAIGKPIGQVAPEDLLGIDALTIIGDTLTLGMLPETYKPGKAGKISSLADLTHFPNLTQLTVANQTLNNIEPVGDLTKLHTLMIANCGVRNISALSNLAELTTLYLYNNQIRDIAPLAGLPLTTLGISQNLIADLSPLQGMNTLADLYLADNKIEDTAPLASLKGLVNLSLDRNPVQDWLSVSHLLDVSGRPSDYNPISFQDPVMEHLLRQALNKPTGFLFPEELAKIDQMALIGNALSFTIDASPYAAGQNGTVATLQDLIYFKGLTALRIQDNAITDLSPIGNLTKLTTLIIGGTQAETLSGLSDLTSLSTLAFYNNPGLTTLEGLPLHSLTSLTVNGSNLTNITALKDAKFLTTLHLTQNAIEDITSIASLEKLTDLSLADNQVSDLQPLAKLNKLSALDVSNNPIVDWQAVSHLQVVSGRPAYHDPIIFADPGFEKMLRKTIDRAKGAITAADLEGLVAISIDGNTLSLSPENYDLHEPGKQGTITSLADLAYFKDLALLVIQDQPVSDLAPLAGLTGLEHVAISGCKLRDIAPLASLPSLRTLLLPNDGLAQLSPLPASVQFLDLSSNSLQDITALSSLQNLVQLNLRNNQIENISPLTSLANLQTLDLYGNQVASLTTLADLGSLINIDLTGNPVSDWTPVSFLDSVVGRPEQFSPIAFQDPIFEALLRKALGRMEGFLTPADIQGIQALTITENSISLSLEIPEEYKPGAMGGITTLADLSRFPNLTDLYIQDQNAADLSPLAQLSDLAYLSLNHCEVMNLVPLKGLTNLRYLYLYDNQIADLSPLEGLPLSCLALSRNRVQDIAPLSGMVELRQLWLTGNQISTIEPLGKLVELTHLYITNNMVADLSPLANLRALVTLYATGNPIQNWEPVAHVPEVAGRTLENSPVVFSDPLFEQMVRQAMNRPEGSITAADLASIQALTIVDGRMVFALDIPGVYEAGEMGNLATLDDLRHFVGLTSLYIQDQPLSTITPVAQLENLNYLGLNHCALTDISPLANLTTLETLYLYDNEILDISPLRKIALTRLGMSRNQLTDISALSDMTSLSKLWMNGNSLTDISPLEGLTELSALYLSENRITDVSPLANHKKLAVLTLDGNEITNWSPVASYPAVVGMSALDKPIQFADKSFERMLRQAMGQSDGAITPRALQSIQEMTIGPDQVSFSISTDENEKNTGKMKTLADLAYFTNLSRLGVRHQPIGDLTPLSGLNHLQYLAVTGCEVKNLYPLAGLDMTRLGLSDNEIKDLSPLAGLTNLTHLYLGNNKIEDVSALRNLTGLMELNLAGNRISDPSPLVDLPRLSLLYLTDNPIKDWMPLSHVPTVYGRPEDATPITFSDPSFEAMLRVALQRPVGNILPHELASIQGLTIVGNTMDLTLNPPPADVAQESGSLTSFADLRYFSKLAQLYVRFQPVSDLSPLADLKNLTFLTLSECQVQDLSPLAKLPLERLGLFGNQISDLTPLRGMRSLTQLYIGSNQVQDLAPLAGLTRLTHLNIADNQVQDLSALAKLKQLEHLYLGGNPINDFLPIQNVKNIYGP